MKKDDKVLFDILNHDERVTFTVTHGKTKQKVKVILEGNGNCCKDIRDKIVVGWSGEGWNQGNLYRERIEGG